MCRVLLYLGKPVLLDNLLYRPDNSLIKQSFAPRLMIHIQNLAGFGMAAWNQSVEELQGCPYFFKTQQLPFFDKNIKRLATKIKANCLLAHVRGVEYSEKEIVNQENVHPFMYENFKLALAHNGVVAGIRDMRSELLKYIKPNIYKMINGTTDSEWVYALMMSQFSDPTVPIELEEASNAVLKTFEILSEVRDKLNISYASPLNLFITNGNYLLITRFVFDFGRFYGSPHAAHLEYHSLWYTYGEEYGFFDDEYKMRGAQTKQSVIFASEPLTKDTTTWIEVPEYSLGTAWRENDEIIIRTQDINL